MVLSRNSLAEACSDHAKLAGEGLMTPTFAVDTCTEALVSETLTRDEKAIAHINRGVVQLTMMELVEDAARDFDAAAELKPELGESYANRGAVLLTEDRYAEAVAEIDKAMTLGLKEPWKAYFNRALAKERLNDVKGAYDDLKMALQLRPGWQLAEAELARYQVRSP